MGAAGLGVIITLVVLGWLATGFYVVEQGEQAVELRFGEFKEIKEAGLRWHMPLPIESKELVNVQKIRTVEVGYRTATRSGQLAKVPSEALMLTTDENIIDIQFAVQFDVRDPKELLFNVSEPDEQVVRQATESAVREVIGLSTMDRAITGGRSEIAQSTRTLLQEILDRYQSGLNIRNVEMQNAQPPEEVKPAFDDAVKAREDQVRIKNEAEAYSNDILPRAKGQAARLLQEAEAYEASKVALAEGEASRFTQVLEEYLKAPVITRDRLYIEAMESVLGNSTKLVIDQKSGGNNVMYLPLDQLIKGQQSRATAATGGDGVLRRHRHRHVDKIWRPRQPLHHEEHQAIDWPCQHRQRDRSAAPLLARLLQLFFLAVLAGLAHLRRLALFRGRRHLGLALPHHAQRPARDSVCITKT